MFPQLCLRTKPRPPALHSIIPRHPHNPRGSLSTATPTTPINSTPPLPRAIGTGESKPASSLPRPSLPWYKQSRFHRGLVNILLLGSFANSAAIILSYKSQKREISWQSKERIQTLMETIEKVRRGEEIDVRAALGTGNPEMEKRWDDLLKEIVEEDLTWKEAAKGEKEKEKKDTKER